MSIAENKIKSAGILHVNHVRSARSASDYLGGSLDSDWRVIAYFIRYDIDIRLHCFVSNGPVYLADYVYIAVHTCMERVLV